MDFARLIRVNAGPGLKKRPRAKALAAKEKNTMRLPRYSAISAIVPSLLLCWVIAATGCATTNPKVAYRLDDQGHPYDYKREERYAQRDYFHHWVRSAYNP